MCPFYMIFIEMNGTRSEYQSRVVRNDKGIFFTNNWRRERKQLHEQNTDEMIDLIAIACARDIFLSVGNVTIAHESIESRRVTTCDEGRKSQC